MVLIKVALWWIVVSVPAWLLMISLVAIGFLPRALLLGETYSVHSIGPSISFFGLILWWLGINIEAAVKNANDPDNVDSGLRLPLAVAASVMSAFCIAFVWLLSAGDLLGSVLWFTVYAFPIMLPIWLIAIASSWLYLKEKNEEALAARAKAADQAAKEAKKIEVAPWRSTTR